MSLILRSCFSPGKGFSVSHTAALSVDGINKVNLTSLISGHHTQLLCSLSWRKNTWPDAASKMASQLLFDCPLQSNQCESLTVQQNTYSSRAPVEMEN